ncbi:MAG: triacylglycerol lipase [Lachnospiraceae bacterium]|nr:triacylglycerol lipase [Lachnospiraceae bacterium]
MAEITRNVLKYLLRLVSILILFLLANSKTISLLFSWKKLGIITLVLFVVICIIPSVFNLKIEKGKLRQTAQGNEMLIIFFYATVLTILYSVPGFLGLYKVTGLKLWINNSIIAFVILAIAFWNGMLRVYFTSTQLGIRYRLIGALVGWIPILHLIALGKIIKVTGEEVRVEHVKNVLNERRKKQQICKTKYPILLVHGIFFRDSNLLNYWGRIPDELIKNGATIFYGNQQSAASVEDCGIELTNKIKEIINKTGAEKVNIIGHSKGGLDSRYAISIAGAAPYVASLTTINTPHRGCEFAEYLLKEIPENQQKMIANAYNATLKKLGDPNPDFMEGVTDLTTSNCEKNNNLMKDVEGVYYQSVGSILNVSRGGRFPLNLTTNFVKYFDGPNDGLVGVNSFEWGENYQLITVKGNRGISHGDMIDLNRENFDEFDVREFYVQLVNGLKEMGF